MVQRSRKASSSMTLARQMRKEYALIVARGFVLQLDCAVYPPLE